MSSSSIPLDIETDMERQSSPATSLRPSSSLAPSPPPLSDYSRASSEAGFSEAGLSEAGLSEAGQVNLTTTDNFSNTKFMSKVTDYDEEGEKPPKPNLSGAHKDEGVC